jgi:diguanylate cyclase (GGDEF)-like protein
MLVILKFLIFIIFSVGLEIFGILKICSNFNQVVYLVIIFSIADVVFILAEILIPIVKLYNALKAVDFNESVVDFSKLDSLDPSGFEEIRKITEKFKYLLDIITERINKINKATFKSEHDGLSGCYNRVRLESVKNTYELAKSVAVIFIDVNNLKRMNDEFGHDAGDSLIKSAANKLSFWDAYGDVYRMGGDEFMIVILNQPPKRVNEILDRWYPTVGQLNRSSDSFKCVLSYGVAFGQKGCNFDEVQKQADDRMYEFKVAIKKKFGEPMR